MVFALFIGVNNTSAQSPCDCLDAIDAAISAVESPAFDECEFVDDYDWKVPPSLRKNLAKARRSCKNNPPAVENILRGMIETIDETLLGGESVHPWKTEFVLIDQILNEISLVVYNPPAPLLGRG